MGVASASCKGNFCNRYGWGLAGNNSPSRLYDHGITLHNWLYFSGASRSVCGATWGLRLCADCLSPQLMVWCLPTILGISGFCRVVSEMTQCRVFLLTDMSFTDMTLRKNSNSWCCRQAISVCGRVHPPSCSHYESQGTLQHECTFRTLYNRSLFFYNIQLGTGTTMYLRWKRCINKDDLISFLPDSSQDRTTP